MKTNDNIVINSTIKKITEELDILRAMSETINDRLKVQGDLLSFLCEIHADYFSDTSET